MTTENWIIALLLAGLLYNTKVIIRLLQRLIAQHEAAPDAINWDMDPHYKNKGLPKR